MFKTRHLIKYIVIATFVVLLLFWKKKGRFYIKFCDVINMEENKEIANRTNYPRDFKDMLFYDKFQKIKQIKEKLNNGSFKIPTKIPRFLVYGINTGSKSFWTRQWLDITNNRCVLPCNLTTDEREHSSVDAILFYIRSTNNKSTIYEKFTPRNFKQPWIVYSYEPHMIANSVFKTNYHEFDGVFNRTMYYRRDSDIMIHHGFVVPKSEADKYLPESWHMPVDKNYSDRLRTMAAAMISNCNDKSGRLRYALELDMYIKVDIYGKCGKLKCDKSNYIDKDYSVSTDECLNKVGTNYYFYLAFENSLCSDYLTEKIYNILYFPIIPVVLGGADYSELLPPNSYIDASKITPKQLACLMLNLVNNPKEYFSYFEWKKYYSPSTIGSVRLLCDLCVRLYDEDLYKHNVVNDFYDWFVTKSHCVDGSKHPPWLDS